MAVEALAAAVLISCLTVTSVIQSHKKKPSLIRSPVNTAKFFWPIGNRINWVRLYKKERVVYHFTMGSKRRNGRFFLLTSIGKTVYSLTWIVIFFFHARSVNGEESKRGNRKREKKGPPSVSLFSFPSLLVPVLPLTALSDSFILIGDWETSGDESVSFHRTEITRTFRKKIQTLNNIHK